MLHNYIYHYKFKKLSIKSLSSVSHTLSKRVSYFIIDWNANNVKTTKALEHQRLCLRSNWLNLNCLFSFLSSTEQSVGLIKSHKAVGCSSPFDVAPQSQPSAYAAPCSVMCASGHRVKMPCAQVYQRVLP